MINVPLNKKSLSIVVIILGTIALFFLGSNSLPKIETISPTITPSEGSAISNMIRVEKPIIGQLITSPFTVSGEARGNWYFEASFPVRIYDDNGLELGVVVAQAQGEWMTTEFVPFRAILKFNKPVTESGVVVFQKDNPSGLPEHDAELRIPIVFDLENWPVSADDGQGVPAVLNKCKATGCSGQICSEEDVVTTCEFSPEYACYKTAKCERQSDGNCGWTPSEELVACLYSAWGAPVE